MRDYGLSFNHLNGEVLYIWPTVLVLVVFLNDSNVPFGEVLVGKLNEGNRESRPSDSALQLPVSARDL
jgi:hypothetical protein